MGLSIGNCSLLDDLEDNYYCFQNRANPYASPERTIEIVFWSSYGVIVIRLRSYCCLPQKKKKLTRTREIEELFLKLFLF